VMKQGSEFKLAALILPLPFLVVRTGGALRGKQGLHCFRLHNAEIRGKSGGNRKQWHTSREASGAYIPQVRRP
jgi:hypothetical protein